MRLVRKESVDEPQEGTEEYRHAIKSVIKCQIQSLLQKLASELGEETIVISTNVTAGTYSQFGSFMGREFLEEKDDYVQSMSYGFNAFCSEKQKLGLVQHDGSDYNVGTEEIHSDVARTTLPAPRKKTPRKRPLTPNYESHSNKRKQTHYPVETGSSQLFNKSMFQYQSNMNTSPGKGGNSIHMEGSNSSQFTDRNSSQCEREVSKIYVPNVPFIKSEPIDDYTPMSGDYRPVTTNGNSPDNMISHDTDVSPNEESAKNSIANRPTSLIPLANIFKKYGTKPIKNEPMKTPESIPESQDREDNLPSEKSILRSLYNQPLYGLEDNSSGTNDFENTGQVGINLPSNLGESMDQFPSTTENLVLSGYYDSESYPAYRHNKKHPANSSSKKSKGRDKASTGNTSSSANPSYVDSLVSPGGSDLKMRMFESGGRLVYACDVCKRELSHLTSYRRHMKLHTMDRPHKCPVCSKGFIRKYHCIDHLNKHHKGVDFDHDTLTIRGSSKSLNESTSYSESLSVSPGEYNYTLDQSLEETDQSVNASVDQSVNASIDQSMNASIDQSASNMLSELARSAQKAQLLHQSESEIIIAPHSEPLELNQSEDDTLKNCQLEGIDSKTPESESSRKENENPDDVKVVKENGSELDDQPIKSSLVKPESSSLARKYEVTEGIKAIVAHLKSSSKKKKMTSDREISPECFKTEEEV
ncbi:zinc finger E-box-binding homeobox 1-like [Ruditapes philippinarum]|uniref:zinc finger E-box-binding homeobox 1-like n=1 Tax=Ruditapes philippinarum TaxID=129788 RepID=UPI00295A9D14|nr:zinc finger E-box-binding homeobox 1-like [Ruditapes philippinarum]